MPLKNQIIKNNYHTHTYLCTHAVGTVEDYVLEAIKNNFHELGMSDHAPFPELFDVTVRMKMEDYPIYLKELNNAINKYSNKIKIYKGLEIEYFTNKNDYIKGFLKDLDYLVLGQHYIETKNRIKSVTKIKTIEEAKIYKEIIIEAMKTRYFKLVAHPDLFLFNIKELSKEWLDISEEIIIAAKNNNMVLEINSNGIRRKIKDNRKNYYHYPRVEFWELVKKHNVKCIISSDAHNPNQLLDLAVKKTVEFANSLQLEVEEVLVIN